jgi:hypothetical protein
MSIVAVAFFTFGVIVNFVSSWNGIFGIRKNVKSDDGLYRTGI